MAIEVPFERLGAGQVGRLAYQVIGNNGPIPNPSRIRYMAPSAMRAAGAVAGAPVPGAMAVLGIANLAVGVANLAISAEVLATVRRTEVKIDRIEEKVDRLWLNSVAHLSKLSEIASDTKAIKLDVAEHSLRESLRWILARATIGDEIDLAAMDGLVADLDKFTSRLDEWRFGWSGNLQLSSDVKAMLHAVFRLQYSAQAEWIAAYNRSVSGDPSHVQRHPLDAECRYLLTSASIRVASSGYARQRLERLGGELNDARQDLHDNVVPSLKIGPRSPGKWSELQRQMTEWFDHKVGGVMNDVGTSIARGIRGDIHVPGLDMPLENWGDVNIAEAERLVQNYLAGWLLSDAGLVWRTRGVLALRSDASFWGTLGPVDLAPMLTVPDLEQLLTV